MSDFYSKYILNMPEDWDEKVLSDEIEMLMAGVSVNSTDDLPIIGDLCVLKTSAVFDGSFYPNECKKIKPEDIPRAKLNPLQDSIVISRMNTPALVGECGYVDSTHVHLFLPDRLWQTRFFQGSKIDVKWLSYLLNTPEYKVKIKSTATGTSNSMKNISKDSFLSIKIPSPPLFEQKAIANILGLIDTAINKTDQLIVKKEAQKKALMQKLLTGTTRLKGFGGNWAKYTYNEILSIVRRDFEWSENELYKLISVRRRSGGIFFRDPLYGHQILVKNLRTAQEGDFLFSKMQILHGASALVTKEFSGAKISGSYIAVVAKDPEVLNINFLSWYSQTPAFYHQTYVSSYGVHIEKMTFDFESFLALEMKLPSKAEQLAIDQVLRASDKEIELVKTKVEKLKEQKKGLMQVLLTGIKRLKVVTP